MNRPLVKVMQHGGALRYMLTYKCTSRPALSPWLSQPICSSPPSPLRAAMCPRRLRVSQNSPRVIQQHINLLKPQPFQKGRRQSNFGAVVRGQHHITLSNAPFRHSWLRWHAVWRTDPCIFLSPCISLLFSTYLSCLGALSKSHSLSLSVTPYL